MSKSREPGKSAAAPPGEHRLSLQQAMALAHQHLNEGKLPAAEALVRKVLAVNAGHPDALHLLAMIALRVGRGAEALALLRQAATAPGVPALYLANLCEMERQQGNMSAAEQAGRQALQVDPDFPQALNNLGIVLQETGRESEALALFDRLLEIKPDYAQAHSNRGNTLKLLERADEAVAALRRAVSLAPDFAQGWSNLAVSLNAQRNWLEAEKAARRAIELAPNNPEAHSNLAVSLRELQRLEDALAAVRQALTLRPDYPEALSCLALVYRDMGLVNQAIEQARKACSLKRSTDTLMTLGQSEHMAGRAEAAEQAFREALSLAPDAAGLHNNLGHSLLDQGRKDEAEAAFRQALALRPGMSEVYLNLSMTRRFSADDSDIDAMRTLMAQLDPEQPGGQQDRIQLSFALGKALQDCGEYEQAFSHFLEGNRLNRATFEYDAGDQSRRMQRIAECFDQSTLSGLAGKGDPDAAPIFIVGMPRSGTSLVEQILASHPQVFGAGELSDIRVVTTMSDVVGTGQPFPDYATSLDANALRKMAGRYLQQVRARIPETERFTDKMPANFSFLGLIRLMFPNARIIHCNRNPMDTCVSCFTLLFSGYQPFSYDLRELGQFYRDYQGLMQHWRDALPQDAFLDLVYEDLVDDLEPQARRLLDFCGLEWDPACLSFHETKRAVRTASISQVRQPIYRSSVERWRRYEPWLGPLREALSEA